MKDSKNDRDDAMLAKGMPPSPPALDPLAAVLASRSSAGNMRRSNVSAELHSAGAGAALVAGARDLAASAVAADLDRPERTSRARRAADAVADLATLAPVLDVYADGRHSRIADTVARASHPVTNANAWGGLDGQAAAEREALDATHRALSMALGEVRPVALGDLAGRACRLLNGPLAVPAENGAQYGDVIAAPMWPTIPAATVDGAPGDPIARVEGVLTGAPIGWHSAAAVIPGSGQSIDWTAAGPELDRLLGLVVDVALEQTIVADLETAAVAAASFSAAEIAAGATGLEADTIVCHPADKPKIIRAYATEGIDPDDRPAIIPTAGATVGTALVLAAGAVRLLVTDGVHLDALEPKAFGIDIAAARWAQVSVRLAGAVQSVSIA